MRRSHSGGLPQSDEESLITLRLLQLAAAGARVGTFAENLPPLPAAAVSSESVQCAAAASHPALDPS